MKGRETIMLSIQVQTSLENKRKKIVSKKKKIAANLII